MEMRRWWWRWLRLIVTVAAASTRWQVANSDNFYFLGSGCSNKPATNALEFSKNLDTTFSDLRIQLQSSENTRLATAEGPSSLEPAYAMVQCRNFMSQADCLACYDRLRINITTCTNNSVVTGGRVASDGCFLRYENYTFYERTSDNWVICDNASHATPDVKDAFSKEGERLLNDLRIATPRIKNVYFAASKTKVGESSAVYAVAQCTLNVSEDGCQGCLTAALQSLKEACLPSMSDGRVVDVACFMRYSNTSFFLDNQTTNIKPFLNGGINVGAVIGGTVGGALLLVIVSTTFVWFKFSRQLKTALIANILGATELQHPNTYSYKDLKEATDNFSEQNKLGRGAFGTVYKATLRNKSVVAVKKLDMRYSRAKADYESEVRLISNVHHRNRVRLLGCCHKGSELILVYKYMENKSLDRFLYGENRGTLSWKQRFQIILGTARGIEYLHENYHVTIIHRDIKPGNILLDNQFQPKIADFGLARLLPHNQTHLSTGFAGTLGYTAPEYAIHGHLSEKVDIYSFGIVILEIISGRKCSDVDPDSATEYLLREAWKLYERGMHQNLADVALDSNEYEVEELKKMVEIAMLCVQSSPPSRPTMSQLIYMISSDKDINGWIGERGEIGRPSFSHENENIAFIHTSSHATDSITHFTGR